MGQLWQNQSVPAAQAVTHPSSNLQVATENSAEHSVCSAFGIMMRV